MAKTKREHNTIYYNKNKSKYKWRLNRLVAMARNRAKSKGLDFNIDSEYVVQLWEDNFGCCALTGINFDLNFTNKKGQVNPNTVSIDRINPQLGYIKGNIRLITYHMNVALSEYGIEQFEILAKSYLGSR